MANRAIKNKELTDSNNESKKYKAYAMEESRLKKAKKLCMENKDCSEYNSLGGDNRLREVENLVHHEQKKDKNRRETQKHTTIKNLHQKDNGKSFDIINYYLLFIIYCLFIVYC